MSAHTARQGIFNVLTGRAVCPAPRPVDEAEGLLAAYRAEVLAETHTVYRAEHDSIVMGLYTTPEAAREHCEAFLRRESPTAFSSWIEDEEDGVAELVVTVNGEQLETGYTVTPLEVASEHDEDGDE